MSGSTPDNPALRRPCYQTYVYASERGSEQSDHSPFHKGQYNEDCMSKPHRGTVKHVSWMINKVIEVAEKLGVPVRDLHRDAFLKNVEEVTRTDIDACMAWSHLKSLAETKDLAIRGPVGEANLPIDPAVPEGYYVKQLSTQLDKEGEIERQWIKTPLTQAPGILTDQIPDGHTISGVSTLVSGDGHTLAQWVKTRKESESKEALLLRLMQDLPNEVPARKGKIPAPTEPQAKEMLAVYPMGDPHIGMLSWAPETGEDFDLGKAQKVMTSAMRELVTRGPRTERALIVNLGDFFHSDNEQNKTARSGHALDVDGRWPKVLQVGIEIMVFMIDQALMHHQHVRVVNEIGNHDDHSAMFLSVVLSAYYRNEPRVEIDMSPSRFHWHRFGKNLIGITHGHNQKHGDLESIMAAERAADWGATIHRFWYCGHIHHSVKREMRGCVIESFRTLATRDAWAANAGYRSGRDMNRITLHEEYGEVGREIVNAAYLQARYKNE